MKLQIVSDLHLSRAPCELPDVGADLLIVAGDLGRPAPAMAWARAQPLPVIFVAGNHEFYGETLGATRQLLRALAAGSRVTVLDCDEVHVGGLRLLGATLWTDFRLFGDGPPREQAMAAVATFSRDFSQIRGDDGERLTPAVCAACFEREATWLAARLAEPFAGPTVVVTHFAPSPRSIAARFTGSLINAGFVSDLETLVAGSGAVLWVHGHTHDSFDYRLGATRVLANPRGYVQAGVAENPAFDPGLCIVVG